VVGFCEHGNEPLVRLKSGNLFSSLSRMTLSHGVLTAVVGKKSHFRLYMKN
jgi:hypothetical protein